MSGDRLRNDAPAGRPPRRASRVGDEAPVALPRVLDLLLRLYPTRTRRESAKHLRPLIADVWRAGSSTGPLGRAWLMTRLAVDLIVGALMARVRPSQGSSPNPGSSFPSSRERLPMMDGLKTDLRQSLRALAGSPGLFAGAALTLALGIGATTTVFSIVHGAVGQLPFDEPEELVVLTQIDTRTGSTNLGARPFDLAEWSNRQATFERLAAFRSASMNVADAGLEPERRPGVEISPSAFGLLGVSAARGRLLEEGDAAADAPHVVVIAEELWQARYASAPDIVGRTMRINGVAHTIVGVLPVGFGFPVHEQIWTPLRLGPGDPGEGPSVSVFGRLRDGVSIEQAASELDGIALDIARAHPDTNEGLGVRVRPFVEMEMDPETLPVLYVMLLAVSFVLAIACANVANLLLARAATRTRDVAIRTALGASRRRLVVQQLIESGLVAAVGGVGGVLAANAGVRFFDRATANVIEAFWIDFRVDGVVLAFATALVCAAGLIAGVLPALRASALPPGAVLKDEGASGGLRIGRLGRSLVIGELALVCGLLAVSGALGRTALAMRSVELPFDSRGILSAELSIGNTGLEATERARVLRDVATASSDAPGVDAAALVSSLPGRGGGVTPFMLDGVSAQDFATATVAVSPGFLGVLGGALLRGRDLAWSDDAASERVAWVNESWVRRFSPEEDPIGRLIAFTEGAGAASPNEIPKIRIIGVISDLQIQDPGDPRADGVYLALLQNPPSFARLIARGAGDPLALTPLLRERIASVDPDMPMFEVATLRDAIYADASVLDAFVVLFLVFGGGALFLAIIGVYGVVSFAVSQRTREFGVRIALGARGSDILRMVLRQGGKSVLIGTAIGLVLATAISRTLAALIDQVETSDLTVALGVVGVLILTGATALVIPARRAAAVAPVTALRQD